MRVAVLADPANADGTVGGAELTMREFAGAAPAHVDLVDDLDCETVVVGNCTSFGPDLIPGLAGRRVVWFHNDLSPHNHPELKGWLDAHATHIFCSPLQRGRYVLQVLAKGLAINESVALEGNLVPPAIDLRRFKPTRQVQRNGSRSGNVAVGSWQNPGKGQQLLKEWADEHGTVDVYGEGPFVPHGENLELKGPVEPAKVAQTLWGYETAVHLPTVVEPFGRFVVEAWAAGLRVVVNRLVGARYWIEEKPERLETAAGDFWDCVLDA